MNNQELQDTLSTNPVTRPFFRGVFFPDEFPPKPLLQEEDNKATYIFNTASSHNPGEHWIAICLRSNKDNVYFDSYGLEPCSQAFVEFMDHTYQFNQAQLQQYFTTSCGQWCMFFIWHQSLDIALNEMIKGMGDIQDPLVTDHKMNLWANRIFGTDEKVIDKEFVELKKKEV